MSQPGRVRSKNLFQQLRLEGQYDPELLADMARHKDLMGHMMAKMAEALKAEDDGTAIAMITRETVDTMFGGMNDIPFFVEKQAACHQEELTVPSTPDNNSEVKVLVHRPKALEGPSPAVVYIHGGGVVAGRAAQFKGHCSSMADSCGVIFFNVDYRLAPEAKCPENVKDAYSALKHILGHAASLGVDPARVAIMGESGGGHLTAALSVMLAQRDESHLVKLAVPIIPMVDDYAWTDPLSMTREEMEMAVPMKAIYNAIATDLEAQRARSDPLLFPAKAPEDLLSKFPPTVILEVEFDFYITEATRFARRLRAAGRLLEVVVVPGLGHGQAHEPRFQKFHEMMAIVKQLVQEYLVN